MSLQQIIALLRREAANLPEVKEMRAVLRAARQLEKTQLNILFPDTTEEEESW